MSVTKKEKESMFILIEEMDNAGMNRGQITGIPANTNEEKRECMIQMLAVMKSEGRVIGESEITEARLMAEVDKE